MFNIKYELLMQSSNIEEAKAYIKEFEDIGSQYRVVKLFHHEELKTRSTRYKQYRLIFILQTINSIEGRMAIAFFDKADDRARTSLVIKQIYKEMIDPIKPKKTLL